MAKRTREPMTPGQHNNTTLYRLDCMNKRSGITGMECEICDACDQIRSYL